MSHMLRQALHILHYCALAPAWACYINAPQLYHCESEPLASGSPPLVLVEAGSLKQLHHLGSGHAINRQAGRMPLHLPQLWPCLPSKGRRRKQLRRGGAGLLLLSSLAWCLGDAWRRPGRCSRHCIPKRIPGLQQDPARNCELSKACR